MISTSKDLFQFAQVQKGHGVNITTEYQTAEVFGVMYSEKKNWKSSYVIYVEETVVLTGNIQHNS